MDKKWSCPACEYQSGRGSNVARHISRKHGDYDVPVLTEFQNTGFLIRLPRLQYPYFPHPRQDSIKDILEKKKKISYHLTNSKIKNLVSIRNSLMH